MSWASGSINGLLFINAPYRKRLYCPATIRQRRRKAKLGAAWLIEQAHHEHRLWSSMWLFWVWFPFSCQITVQWSSLKAHSAKKNNTTYKVCHMLIEHARYNVGYLRYCLPDKGMLTEYFSMEIVMLPSNEGSWVVELSCESMLNFS